MKKFTIYFLSFLFVLIGRNTIVQAQIHYIDAIYGQFATSNSRVVTTIKEIENSDEVHIEAILIGELNVGTFEVSLKYNPNAVVPINGPGGSEITNPLIAAGTDLQPFLWLNPALPNISGWWEVATGQLHPEATEPWLYILVGGNEYLNTNEILPAGQIRQIFKIYFKKKSGQILTQNTFTYYEKLTFPPARNLFSRGSFLYMTGETDAISTFDNVDVFTRRTPSTINATTPEINGNQAILKGIAQSAGLPKVTPQYQVTGGLDWDNIVSTGFIYSQNNVVLTINDYANELRVNGISYTFPTSTEISTGTFTRGGYTFNITSTLNTLDASTINMVHTLNGLTLNQTYYVYSYMLYHFQTSDTYPAISNRREFTTGCDKVNPPIVTTLYKLCPENSSPTLNDIYVQGENIQWYEDAGLTIPLTLSTPLEGETTYYVTQTINGCRSEYSYARVLITSELDAPDVASPQSFCTGSTFYLKDIVLPSGVNVVWYIDQNSTTQLNPNTTIISNGQSYWAAQTQNDCESEGRTRVTIVITNMVAAPVIKSPQYFCSDIMLISVNTKPYDFESIVWFEDVLGTQPITDMTKRLTPGTYYAALKLSATCISNLAAIVLDTNILSADFEAETQRLPASFTVANIVISGWGIKWFEDAAMQNEITDLSTVLIHNTTYYAANTLDDCLIPYKAVKVLLQLTVMGTVFPFVDSGFPEFDGLFPISISLKRLPDPLAVNPVYDLLNATPVYGPVRAGTYNGNVFVPNTPRNPGALGSLSNFGYPINFLDAIGTPQGTSNSPILSVNQTPITANNVTLGLYRIPNVEAGSYVLEFKRDGFMLRWALLKLDPAVGMTHYETHRELIPGDFNNDLQINASDGSLFRANMGTFIDFENMNSFIPVAKYDINSDGNIDNVDFSTIRAFYNFLYYHYMDTKEMLEELGIQVGY